MMTRDAEGSAHRGSGIRCESSSFGANRAAPPMLISLKLEPKREPGTSPRDAPAYQKMWLTEAEQAMLAERKQQKIRQQEAVRLEGLAMVEQVRKAREEELLRALMGLASEEDVPEEEARAT